MSEVWADNNGARRSFFFYWQPCQWYRENIRIKIRNLKEKSLFDYDGSGYAEVLSERSILTSSADLVITILFFCWQESHGEVTYDGGPLLKGKKTFFLRWNVKNANATFWHFLERCQKLFDQSLVHQSVFCTNFFIALRKQFWFTVILHRMKSLSVCLPFSLLGNISYS